MTLLVATLLISALPGADPGFSTTSTPSVPTIAVENTRWADAGDAYRLRILDMVDAEIWRIAQPILTAQGWSVQSPPGRNANVLAGAPPEQRIRTLITTVEFGCTLEMWLLLQSGKSIAFHRDEIAPCSPDNLVATASSRARQLAGASHPKSKLGKALTPLNVTTIEIPRIPDVGRLEPRNGRRNAEVASFAEAIEAYQSVHLRMVDGPEGPIVLQNETPIDDCELYRIAWKRAPAKLRRYCSGNRWEWALVALPIPFAVGWLTYDPLKEGDFLGVVGFTMSVVSGLTIAALAFALNLDGQDPLSGEHYLGNDELRAITSSINGALRDALDLTAREVEASGLPR